MIRPRLSFLVSLLACTACSSSAPPSDEGSSQEAAVAHRTVKDLEAFVQDNVRQQATQELKGLGVSPTEAEQAVNRGLAQSDAPTAGSTQVPSYVGDSEPDASTDSLQNIWQTVQALPYSNALPQYSVTFGSLLGGRFFRASERTLTHGGDLLSKPFRKLIRPNGICYKGTWETNDNAKYAGFLGPNVKAPIVARLSVGFSDTTSDRPRAFGLSGKLFPPKGTPQLSVRTTNFFVIDDNGGTLGKGTPYNPDIPMTNKPPFHPQLKALGDLPTQVALKVLQEGADRWVSFKSDGGFGGLLGKLRSEGLFQFLKSNAGSTSGVRQLYPLVQAFGTDVESAKAPEQIQIWVKSRPKNVIPGDDFRHELRLDNFENRTMVLGVRIKDGSGDPVEVGTISFTEEALTQNCDQRLHFAHPTFEQNQPH